MSEKITFKELVEKIAEQSQQSYNSTNSFIHELVQIIEGGLSENGSVTISGFGKFELKWMKERPGVNPQTGEEITIPGQNKVVFKPYKALREQVNKPYAKMTAQVLDQTPDDKKEEVSETEDATVGGLIIERENPLKQKKTVPKDTPDDQQKPVALANEEELTDQVEESSRMKWTYAAAALIVLLAIMAAIYVAQQTTEDPSEPAIADQTEQPVQQDEMDQPVAEDDDPTVQTEADETAEEPPPPDEVAETEPESEFELTTHSVNPGESLWTIAENQLGNPYLWPLVYHLNQDILDNPNQLASEGSLEIPTISDPENLTSFEQEQVAMGYFSLYEWAQENDPEEARYFLWAVGVFSPDLLEDRASEVNEEDLIFATQR